MRFPGCGRAPSESTLAGSPLKRHMLIAAWLLALRAGDGLAQEIGLQGELPALEVEASTEAPSDPCELPPDREMLGLDWTRRVLFDTVCSAARWFDGFFGDIRYDDAAPGVRGRLSLGIERREDAGLTTRPRFRVRVPLPNLNKRLSVYFEREDEARSIEGRTPEGQPAVEPISTTSAQDTTQVGFAYRKLKLLDEVVDFRLGLRAPQGELDYYARARYRRAFWQSAATQWRFSQTLYWRHSEGWGETTELDFEARLTAHHLLRWYTTATWSKVTEGVDWKMGFPLYRSLRGGRAIVIEPNLNGQTGRPFLIASYGLRGAYRQALGRRWLFGELYLGEDWIKSAEGAERDAQVFAGFILEVVFDGKDLEARAGAEGLPPQPPGPGETSPVR